jgi:hypothetical protein
MTNPCIIRGGSGGGVLLDYWHEHTASFLLLFLEVRESPSNNFFWSETARPHLGLRQKITVNPNYLVVIFTVATPIKTKFRR